MLTFGKGGLLCRQRSEENFGFSPKPQPQVSMNSHSFSFLLICEPSESLRREAIAIWLVSPISLDSI